MQFVLGEDGHIYWLHFKSLQNRQADSQAPQYGWYYASGKSNFMHVLLRASLSVTYPWFVFCSCLPLASEDTTKHAHPPFSKYCWNVQQFTQLAPVNWRKGKELACLWSRLFRTSANKTNCRVELCYHTRKCQLRLFTSERGRALRSLPAIVRKHWLWSVYAFLCV